MAILLRILPAVLKWCLSTIFGVAAWQFADFLLTRAKSFVLKQYRRIVE